MLRRTGGGVLRERLVAKIRERLAAPDRQRVAKNPRIALLPPFLRELLEAVQVELALARGGNGTPAPE